MNNGFNISHKQHEIKVRLENEKFQRALIRHKKLIAKMVETQDKDLISSCDYTAKELALFYSGFKCEWCGTIKDLQLHHLIVRSVESITDYWKFNSQRHYWANMVILCQNCHMNVHPVYSEYKKEVEDGIITDAKIKKVKKKFEVKIL